MGSRDSSGAKILGPRVFRSQVNGSEADGEARLRAEIQAAWAVDPVDVLVYRRAADPPVSAGRIYRALG